MKRFTILRVARTQYGCFGVFLGEDAVPFALTLERPWLNNQPNISCIPPGVYTCKRGLHRLAHMTHDFTTYQIMDVPGRTNILLHTGNLMTNSEGCILVGEQFGPLNGVPAILASRMGFEEFLRKADSSPEIVLSIRHG